MKGLDKIVEVPFRVYVASAFPTSGVTVTELDLTLANLGARAVAVGSAFEYFRFKRLSAYQFTDIVGPVYNGSALTGQLNAYHALSFVESNATLTLTPTTILEMAQYERFQTGNVYTKLRMAIPKDVLASNAYKWFNTATTGSPTDNLSPGLFTSAVATSTATSASPGNKVLIIEGVIQFRGMITPAASAVRTIPPAIQSKNEDDGDFDFVLTRRGKVSSVRALTSTSSST